MEYRPLGTTGLQVSALGMGTAQLGTLDIDYAIGMVRRAFELGVTYFDTARSYNDSECKIGRALAGDRDKVILSTKTGAKTRDDAWRQIHESLERLRTDYVDNCHMHGIRAGADLDQRTGPSGALEALVEAKEQGLVRHIGATSHTSASLLAALERFDLETILVPMNIVEREPLSQLLPLCQEKGIGITIMKPLATGLLPAPLALKWLLSQGISTAVPGCTTLGQVEANFVVELGTDGLSAAERDLVEEQMRALAQVRCRICSQCQPCPQEINIGARLGTDVMYDHLRTMGSEAFRAHPWSQEIIAKELESRPEIIARIESCDRCGTCETLCPHGLPVVEMLQNMLPPMREMVRIYQELSA